jgi:hypothetical protein
LRCTLNYSFDRLGENRRAIDVAISPLLFDKKQVVGLIGQKGQSAEARSALVRSAKGINRRNRWSMKLKPNPLFSMPGRRKQESGARACICSDA